MRRLIFYLIKVVLIIDIIIFCIFHCALVVAKNKDRIIQKYRNYYVVLLSWLEILENKQSISDYMKKEGFFNIALYGGKDMGYHLIKQLEGTGIEVKYIIDQNFLENKINGLPIYPPSNKLPIVDVVIITPIWDYENIKKQIINSFSCPIISLKDLMIGVRNE